VKRVVVAVALFSAWLALLLLGSPLGKAVYLLLVAALVVFPWRRLSLGADESDRR
jgi:hypothetical protein